MIKREKIISIIKSKFGNKKTSNIPLLKGSSTFKAKCLKEGIEVDNLGSKSFLPWVVFTETVIFLFDNKGSALKGDAMDAKLGDKKLTLNSIEGHIANMIFGIPSGSSVFRRITPISCILEWADICRSESSRLILNKPILLN